MMMDAEFYERYNELFVSYDNPNTPVKLERQTAIWHEDVSDSVIQNMTTRMNLANKLSRILKTQILRYNTPDDLDASYTATTTNMVFGDEANTPEEMFGKGENGRPPVPMVLPHNPTWTKSFGIITKPEEECVYDPRNIDAGWNYLYATPFYFENDYEEPYEPMYIDYMENIEYAKLDELMEQQYAHEEEEDNLAKDIKTFVLGSI